MHSSLNLAPASVCFEGDALSLGSSPVSPGPHEKEMDGTGGFEPRYRKQHIIMRGRMMIAMALLPAGIIMDRDQESMQVFAKGRLRVMIARELLLKKEALMPPELLRYLA